MATLIWPLARQVTRLGVRPVQEAFTSLYGSASGLTEVGDQIFHQDTSGIQGVAETGDKFGEFLATGDFNCDGRSDLAVGAPQEAIGTVVEAGAVNIIYGSASGLSATTNQIWDQDSPNINDFAEANDNFGGALVAGNFDGNSISGHACMDLAIGIPGEDFGLASDTGAVSVLYGTSSGVSATNDQFWHQSVTGVPDTAETDDEFGTRLWSMVGTYDDLFILVPGDSLNGSTGVAVYIGGSPSGLDAIQQSVQIQPPQVPPIPTPWEESKSCGFSSSEFLNCNDAIAWCAEHKGDWQCHMSCGGGQCCQGTCTSAAT